MHRFLDTFEVVQTADRSDHIGGIGPLRPPGLEPSARFAGLQERVEQALRASVGEQALPKIM